MMSMAAVEGKLRKCSHTNSQDSMGQLIHPSTDFKMSVWSSAFILCILIGWVTGKGWKVECHVVLWLQYTLYIAWWILTESKYSQQINYHTLVFHCMCSWWNSFNIFSSQHRIGQFSSQQRIVQFSVATRFTFLFSLFVVIFWRISNSRRILRRELLNIRRELLDSLREFSNSRRNLDENCWIRGENPVKSRQPNCIVLTERTSKFSQPIIFGILVFSCHKMRLITKITGMPLPASKSISL